MWKIRLKTVGNLIVILVSVLLQLWIYRFIYQESKENRMTFMVIGNWVISEKACLAIYILSAAFLYIRIYTGPEKEMFRRALLAGAGPIGLLIFISRLACGGRKIFTVFFLFSVYIVFWSGQAVCLLISGKLRKKHLSVLLRRLETGAIIFLITGMLCGREYGERNIYEVSVGQQGYGKISEEYTDEQNLRTWEKHDELSDAQRKEIYQKLIDSECRYLGIEPVRVQIIDGTGRLLGNYVDETRTISITESGMECGVREVINTLCHEVYHAYSVDLVRVFREIEYEEEELLAFRQIERLELGFDHYNSIGLWEEYLYNSIEVYARSYAENRAEEYCRYLSE